MNKIAILPGSERPDPDQVPAHYGNYVRQAEGDHLFDALEIALDRTLKLAKTFPEQAGQLKYAEDKWTINELLQHIIDTERIFCNRALRFARQDRTSLPGFDHEAYGPASLANRRRTDLLLKELVAVRMATIALFVSFTEEMLKSAGPASGLEIYVNQLGWIIAGHNTHHLKVIQEKYLVAD